MTNIALITGSATRIGAAIVKFLANKNWSVIIHYNESKQEALDLRNKISHNNRIYTKFADLNNMTDIDIMINQINNEIGNINLLINNASYFVNDNINDISFENFNKHMQVNLFAPILLMQKLAALKNIKGNIINMLDYAINYPPDKFLSYFISKSGLWCATQMIARMLAPNIRVNAIAPGPVIASVNQSKINFDKICQNSLIDHCSIDDICNAIDYILNTKSLTGQMLTIDGGKSIMHNNYS